MILIIYYCFVNHGEYQKVISKSVHLSNVIKIRNDRNGTINVLFYTPYWNDPFWLRGNESAVANPPELKNCIKKNCKFTSNQHFLDDITDFDALIFYHAHGWEVDGVYWKIPEKRSSQQFYIFAADE